MKYIWHDCFVCLLPGCSLIFDYWKPGPEPCSSYSDMPEFLNDIPADKPLYVLVSHHHKDHFNKAIFTWASKFPQVRYILSRDTARSVNYLLKPGSTYTGPYRVDSQRVNVLRVGESYTDNLLKFKAFGSTDIGNSYLVEIAGACRKEGYAERSLRIFHAGDLNAWVWLDESTPREVSDALNRYQGILETIQAEAPEIDLVFFPVDSRLGIRYWLGAEIFLREIKVSNFIPMHFCLYESEEERLQRIASATDFKAFAPVATHCIALTEPGEEISLNLV